MCFIRQANVTDSQNTGVLKKLENMDDIMMNADHKTSLPKLCNYEMLPAMVGYPVRMVGKVLNIDGINLTLQSTDGAKVNCVLKQPPKHKLSQIVEITGVV